MALGPASRWNGSTVLRRHVEDMIFAARELLATHVVAATRVGLRFVIGDEWLAAKLANPALVK